MILGNFVAMAQQSIKRMLAYSSIAHAWLCVCGPGGAQCPGEPAVSSTTWWRYTLMSLGAFTMLMVVARHEELRYAFDDYAGLGPRILC